MASSPHSLDRRPRSDTPTGSVPRDGIHRRALIATGVGLAAGLTTAACADADAKARWAVPGPGEPGTSPTPTVKVTVKPNASATGVPPTAPVVVTAEGGTLQTVALSSGDKTVNGTLESDQRTWRSTGTLDYGKSYTVTVTATDESGRQMQHSSGFQTLKPTLMTAATFQANALTVLRSGGTYGVGQPVIVAFDEAIRDRAAAEKALEVTTEPAVEGRWRWISNTTAHWRPAQYWATGTKITVKAKIFGVNLGNDTYGQANTSAQFTIGPSRVAIADYNTRMMECFINGERVKSIPISMGKGGWTKSTDGKTDIHYWTHNGPHVVLSKEGTVRMTSESYGIKDKRDPNYYDDDVKLCTRITYSGEYVHLADWNTSSLGRVNTSHGCINVGPAFAQWFYDTFQVGDVVEVKNSPQNLKLTDGLGDWGVSWSDW